MKVSKNQNEGVSFDKPLYTGVFSGPVKYVNPDKATLCKILDIPEDKMEKEPEYSGEKDGVNFVTLAFWMQAPNGAWFNARYRINDKIRENKDGTKTEWVSQNGGNAWVDDEKNLQETFTHWSSWNKDAGKFEVVKDEKGNTIEKTYREALEGESNLYAFLKEWLSHVDLWNPSDNSILIDKKKLFRDPVKYAKDEYQSLIIDDEDESLVDNLIALATVYVGEKDGNKVQYQNLATKAFLADGMKDAQGNRVTMKKLNNLMQNKAWSSAEKKLKRWYDGIVDETNGVKENYQLVPLKAYDESQYLNESDETLKHSDAGNIDDTDY